MISRRLNSFSRKWMSNGIFLTIDSPNLITHTLSTCIASPESQQSNKNSSKAQRTAY